MFTVRRSLLAVFGCLLATAGIVASPLPAMASLPTCTTFKVYYDANVPSTGSGSVDCLMSQGAHSEAVLFLQYTLNYCYSAGLAQDADFGPRTKAALIKAQRAAGAAQDGGYGPETRSKIQHRGAPPIFGCLRVP